MQSNYLLPNKYKILGWILFLSGLIFGVLSLFEVIPDESLKSNVISLFNKALLGHDGEGTIAIIETGIVNELIALAIIIGGLIVGFSKEKIEDEFIYKLRKDSLVWAIIFNYVVLMFTVVFIYDLAFFNVLIFNMFTPLIFFIVRFNFLKIKS